MLFSIKQWIHPIALLSVLLLSATIARSQHPTCGTSDSLTEKYLQSFSQKIDLSRARITQGEMLEYRLAVDINYQTYLLYNRDKERIEKVIYDYIQRASEVFEKEVNIRLTVTSVLIWDHPEPYPLLTDYDYFTNVFQYWNANRFEARDVVVSLAARSGTFYGGGRMCSSPFPEPSDPEFSVGILCHELGHTLGSPHTHSCYWPGGPIDFCSKLENLNLTDCNDKFQEYVNGSIMSYCRAVLSFHPYCRNLMSAYANGEIDTHFKLAPFRESLTKGILHLDDPTPAASSPRPSFNWNQGGTKFRFQIASNNTFETVVEDTILKPSRFQSLGLDQGNYFARYRPETANDVSGPWSEPINFKVRAFDENSPPPALLQVFLDKSGNVSGHFNKYRGSDAFQIEVSSIYYPYEKSTFDFNCTDLTSQRFQISTNLGLYSYMLYTFRIRKDGIWSKWSDAKNLTHLFSSELASQSTVENASSLPILVSSLYFPNYRLQEDNFDLLAEIEIAEDSIFNNIVYSDTAFSRTMNSFVSNINLFNPTLNENKKYYVRNRVEWKKNRYSNWNTQIMNTRWNDQRFEFKGQVSPNLLTVSQDESEFIASRLFKTDNTLYVYTAETGYYKSNDLKNWKNYTTSNTKGQSSSRIRFFGASETGNSTILYNYWGIHQDGTGNFTYHPLPFDVYHHGPSMLEPATMLKDGTFLFASNRGVASLKNGSYSFLGTDEVRSKRAYLVAKDQNEQIWAFMEEGAVWLYKGNTWLPQPSFPNWSMLRGVAFDNNNIPHVYGDWGVSKLNTGSNAGWENLEPISGKPVKKIVFDKLNQLWAAVYGKPNRQSQYTFSIAKLNGSEATFYANGLNFLRQPFDLEYFKGQLLILTSSGQIHTFDENKIQRFVPKKIYCSDEQLSITLTTNSSLGPHNKISAEFINSKNGNITRVNNLRLENNQVIIDIPGELAEGTYRLRTLLTDPLVVSNESDEFKFSATKVSAPISIIEKTNELTVLATSATSGHHYNWFLNGQEIDGETQPRLKTSLPGNYTVLVRNSDGCEVLSDTLNLPAETPTETVLLQNFPNPVLSISTIRFYLATDETVSLELLNVKGQKLKQLKNGSLSKGWYSVPMDRVDLLPGVYLFRLSAGSYVKTLKLVIV